MYSSTHMEELERRMGENNKKHVPGFFCVPALIFRLSGTSRRWFCWCWLWCCHFCFRFYHDQNQRQVQAWERKINRLQVESKCLELRISLPPETIQVPLLCWRYGK